MKLPCCALRINCQPVLLGARALSAMAFLPLLYHRTIA